MTREEEAKIIRAVTDGNTNAFEDLVTEYQKQVYHIALKMTGNEEDAFDLSQETFLKAYRTLSGGRSAGAGRRSSPWTRTRRRGGGPWSCRTCAMSPRTPWKRRRRGSGCRRGCVGCPMSSG